MRQLNHYFTRSRGSWELKRARGRATRGEQDDFKFRTQHATLIFMIETMKRTQVRCGSRIGPYAISLLADITRPPLR